MLEVLLISDTEDDYILIRDLLSRISSASYDLEWVRSYAKGLEALCAHEIDVCLLAQRIGEHNGLELLRQVMAEGCRRPIIFLGEGENSIGADLEAIRAGAADLLPKDQLTPALLERSIRYAIERRQIQVALQESEQRYRAIVDDQTELICRFQPDGTLTFVNDAYCRHFGESREKLIGKSFVPLIPPEDHERVERHLALLPHLSEEDSIAPLCEHRVIMPDGQIRWQQWRDRAIFDENGCIVEYQSVGRDVTDRKRAEENLRESEERFRELAENIREVFWIRNPEEILYVSPAYEEIWGRSREELFERPDAFTDIIHPEDLERVLRAIACAGGLGGKGEFDHEYRIVRADGTTRWIRARSFPVWKEGVIVRTVGIAEDITERKNAEIGLLQARDSLEEMVRERTFELVRTNAQLRLEIEERNRTQQALEESEERLRYLSSKLLSIQEEERSRLARDLHDSIGQVLVATKYRMENALAQPEIGATSPAAKSLETVIGMVQNGIEETRRICTGLRPFILDDFGVIAAMDWLCEEFQITCRTCRMNKEVEVEEDDLPDSLKIVIFRVTQEALNNVAKHSKADSIELSLKKEGGIIALKIRDNGIGFSTEQPPPPAAQRRGFGLISMRERVGLSGGSFHVDSAAGAGTTVLATWPCAPTG